MPALCRTFVVAAAILPAWRYRAPTDLPLAGVLVPDLTVSAQATMRVEG